MPVFILICWMIGPFSTIIRAKDVVDVKSEVTPVEARARITGKYSGFAPAITALAATISTVYSHASCGGDGRMVPTVSSALWLVPLSISATLSSVGSTMGSPSVH
jgi:hypothetical protein